MASIEVDEEEVRASRTLRQTLSKVLANPKAKLLMQQAHKMVDATAITPELDQAALVTEPVLEMQKRLDDMEKTRKEEKAEAEKNAKLNAITGSIEAGKARLRRDGWTDEGIAGVEKIMDEKGILDPEIAAAYFEKLHPPQQIAASSGSARGTSWSSRSRMAPTSRNSSKSKARALSSIKWREMRSTKFAGNRAAD